MKPASAACYNQLASTATYIEHRRATRPADLSDQTFAVELVIGEIAQRIVQENAVNEHDTSDQIAFVLVSMHEDHGRFYNGKTSCCVSTTLTVNLEIAFRIVSV
jgi:hypothetical protein